ncbi:MAG: hypothetical protein KatS3mg113_0163 [Planctomycetaceae bacterium]|nr:MAG: hypothetical protein KatS3mg113_0163 [Planctomycetaceae bacterium]
MAGVTVAPRVLKAMTPWLAALASLGVLWGAELPLGIPGEWVWPRLPTDPQTGINLGLGVVGISGLLLIVLLGHGRLLRPEVSEFETACWVCLLAAAVCGWWWVVQETAPPLR